MGVKFIAKYEKYEMNILSDPRKKADIQLDKTDRKILGNVPKVYLHFSHH
jgi:hypothetical protein